MKFVRGKRQFPQERIFGITVVTLAGVRTLALIIGTSCWGFQWKTKQKKLASAASVASLTRSKSATGSKSSPPSQGSEPTKTDSYT